MAIKFSQFTVRTSSSDLSHIVGYNGADNIQITPTNFLNSALTGTAGQVLFYDTTGVAGDNDLYWDNTNKRLGVGTASPTQNLDVDGAIITEDYRSAGTFFLTSGDDWRFRSDTGSERIRITSAGNVGIGTTSPSQKLEVVGNIKVGDSEQFIAGAGNDLKIYHNGVNSVIESDTGNLALINTADNRDILFQSDDGSGGTTTYFYLDGSIVENRFSKATRHSDNIIAKFGDANDLNIYSNGSNSYIENFNNDFIISNTADDKDIRFFCDNGSGGTVEYFRLDGANQRNIFSKNVGLGDNVLALFGNGNDMQLFHDGVQSQILNLTGNLRIRNFSDNSDITFESDDGSGGIATYFYLDGGGVLTRFDKRLRMSDAVSLQLGSSGNFEMYHFSGNTTIDNFTGNLTIRNSANDKDISFACDDGSGGATEYFKLDGSSASGGTVYTNWADNSRITLGAGNDMQLYHDGSNNYVDITLGDLYFTNYADDKNIIFRSDNGSGGTTTYFSIDGSAQLNRFAKNAMWNDNVVAYFGGGFDLKIYHDGTDSVIQNDTGDLEIQNRKDDGDIVFKSDDGSGGVTEYFRVDGGENRIVYSLDGRHLDNVKSMYGSGADLQIYHDGSHSYIEDTGTGDLRIKTNSAIAFLGNANEDMIVAVNNAEVSLYHNNVKKLDTRTTGIRIAGVSEYADNAAAIAGGLTTGDVYRTGDLLKIVH